MDRAELPRVSNRLLYIYRVFAKWLSFFIFGVGTLILAVVVFPVMRLIIHPRQRFRKHARRLVSFMMRIFVFIMEGLKVVLLETDDRSLFRGLSSKIIVANHPSLLDVVMLLSLIPNADCIVRARLSKNIVRGIIRQVYILNSLNFDDLSRTCLTSLGEGNCIIIFPEGTRTSRLKKPVLKRGAARLSLMSGCGIIPIRIGGTDKYGLGKKDPWLAFNPQDKYVYRIRMGGEISSRKYADLPVPIAVRRLTGEIKEALFQSST
jgi:1-acyl-sn-glycerol-3-phosphate acyltransferase